MKQDKYAAFFEFVTNRPLEKPWDFKCPICSKDVNILGSFTTLLGWSGRGPDPNHVTDYCRCEEGHKCTRHRKSGNEWICTYAVIVLGIPNCFEPFIYHCAACGGKVMRTTVTHRVIGQPLICKWECTVCHRILETDFEYWTKDQ